MAGGADLEAVAAAAAASTEGATAASTGGTAAEATADKRQKVQQQQQQQRGVGRFILGSALATSLRNLIYIQTALFFVARMI